MSPKWNFKKKIKRKRENCEGALGTLNYYAIFTEKNETVNLHVNQFHTA